MAAAFFIFGICNFDTWILSTFLAQQHFYFLLSSAYGVPLA